MKKLTICIDMDDTIEYLLPAWLEWIANQHHFKVKPEAIKSWDITEYFPHLTVDQICYPLSIPEFWDTVKPMKDAIEIIPRLINKGHKVYICTSTNYKNAKEKFDRCLFKYFPFIDKHNIITCYRKQMVKCDILIDDAIHNLVEGDYIGILITSFCNTDIDISNYPNIYRCDNWYKIEEFIDNFTNAG